MRELPFYTNWSYAHPRAIELAEEVASLAPGDLNRVFFVSGGSEAVESAWKLARQWHASAASAAGRPSAATSPTTARRWARSRSTASRRCARRSSHWCPRSTHVRNTNRYHRPAGRDRGGVHRLPARGARAHARRQAGPDTVAMVIMEPVQNAGGCFMPPAGYFQGVREICDRYGILLVRGRGDLRLRPPRRLVRLREIRHPPGHRHLRQGPVVRVRVDRRADRIRPGRGAVPGEHGVLHARHHLRRAPGPCARSRSRTSRSCSASASSSTSPPTRTRSARRSPSCSICRSSATCAAPVSSTRSSW